MTRSYISCPYCLQIGSVVGAPVADVRCPNCRHPLSAEESGAGGSVWFYARARKIHGPLSLFKLKDMVNRGELFATDLLWRKGTSRWIEAHHIHFFFPPSPSPADKAPPPSAPTASVLPAELDFPLQEAIGPLSLQGLKVKPNSLLTLGDFQILRKLGAGGMGAVYLAHQRSQARMVALKMLARQFAQQPAYVDRFYREAAVLETLDAHPNIVRFYGVGEEKNTPYFAMEYVDGVSVTTLLRHHGGRLPVIDAVTIARACADALHYVHGHAIVHRDIKPENIMITRHGVVKIADLGLAKPIDPTVALTATGISMGTPTYMAPEQARNAKYADQRSDIYALGCVLYHLVAGTRPFHGNSPLDLQVAKEKGGHTPARHANAGVPERLERIIDKMLIPTPDHRYQRCADLIRDLENLNLITGQFTFEEFLLSKHPLEPIPQQRNFVEILLIHDDVNDILLAQEAFEESRIATNLQVVRDWAEALSYLRQQGIFSQAPVPHLIVLGGRSATTCNRELFQEIAAKGADRPIPVVVLTSETNAPARLQSHGIPVNLIAKKPDELKNFEQLVQSIESLFLTAIQRQD